MFHKNLNIPKTDLLTVISEMNGKPSSSKKKLMQTAVLQVELSEKAKEIIVTLRLNVFLQENNVFTAWYNVSFTLISTFHQNLSVILM